MFYSTFKCVTWPFENTDIGSLAYSFYTGGKKRAQDSKGCTSRQAADVLGLQDGTRYNISSMDQGQVDELVGHASGIVGKRRVNLPEHFDGYLI
jgi:hypothetical protein